jgi:hypothetical protein
MRSWAVLLGGLLVWTAHFFLLYGFASIFPGSWIARLLTLAVTVPALAVDSWILWVAARRRTRRAADGLDRWTSELGAAGAALSLVAVAWQALPAMLI